MRIHLFLFHVMCLALQGLPGFKGERGEKVGCRVMFNEPKCQFSILSQNNYKYNVLYRESLSP